MFNQEQPELSFVLVNYKVGRQLAECVQSLQEVERNVACEFIVVDNSPPDASSLLLDRGLRNLRVLSNPANVGYAAACNLGARVCRAPYLWFLNPDVRYVGGSVSRLLEWLDRNPWAALAGPRVLNPDGTRQFSCRSFPTWTTSFSHRYSAHVSGEPAFAELSADESRRETNRRGLGVRLLPAGSQGDVRRARRIR
jgi:GT2 family glycosyltransferase